MIALEAGYTLSDHVDAMQITAIHAYLTRSYWSTGISVETVARAIKNSVCVGVFKNGVQVGFSRVITDCATFAYLADVYVLEEHRGHGLSVAMGAHLQAHPDLQGLRRWMLATSDAHAVYAKLGWTQISDPRPFMQRHFPDVYK
ncbi:MAG: GNAT family N-acetyltransferase [Chakrabartia sp.]